ncbi:2-hydroxyacid dehydrogenase [Oceanicella actignis]|uniref:Lactate dehydrogenase n=1 Tax=Oceanicella actignis TaxID=1189325 RepID=A0A1M7TKA6_9RHOB|nr:D-glycerate dehydrogenase [Oceanicella actignis]SET68013.1 Lactate dehydrogenase [Oceanicella actignis]SHN71157.1 Lactate dehydrogenase [Oceanicella actignis]
MSRPRVIVTRRLPAPVEAALSERFDAVLNPDDVPLSRQDLAAAMRDADAVLCTVGDRIDAEVIGAAPRARLLANFAVGYNHIDIRAAQAAGVVVTNTPGVLTDATADLALTLLLMVARRAAEGERLVRSGAWNGWAPTQLLGAQVTGKTLGIIGMGRIGKAMAARCCHGLRMRIVHYNRSRVTEPGVPCRQLPTVEDVLREADFVSIHCPGGEENRGLISAERLALMKPTAYLINTARGDVVDEDALIEALENRRIAGAGLDVYADEPRVPEALRALDNVVLLPHLGSATRETREAMGMKAFENLVAFFEGREPPDRVV